MSHATRTLFSSLALAALAGAAAAQATTRVSLNGTAQSTEHALTPQISGAGSFAAFSMYTSGGALQHVWVYDTAAGVATDITPGPDPVTGGPVHAIVPCLSRLGRWIAYESQNHLTAHPHPTGASNLYLENIASGAVELISVTPGVNGNATSGAYAALSHDPSSTGPRYVAFHSNTGDLTIPATTPGVFQVYLRDRTAGTTTLVSHAPGGGEGNVNSQYPDISADGRWIVFESSATNLVPGVTAQGIYVYDRTTGTIRHLSRNAAGQPATNGSHWPSISDNGRYVTYNTAATNLLPGYIPGNFEVIVLDRDDDVNGIFDDSPAHNISVSKDSLGTRMRSVVAGYPQISGDGKRVVFTSSAPLVPTATPWAHVYLHDLTTSQTTCVSVSTGYAFGNNSSGGVASLAIDDHGDHVVFVSAATNLVSGDTNGKNDVFLHDAPREPTRAIGSSLPGYSGLAPYFTVIQRGFTIMNLRLRHARPHAFSILAVSWRQNPTPFFGGTVIPAFPLLALGPVFPDANGSFDAAIPLAPGANMFLQWGVIDSAAVQGVALSNALELTIQP